MAASPSIVIGIFKVGQMTADIAVEKTFVTLKPCDPGFPSRKNQSMPNLLARWQRPWEVPSLRELHDLGACRPCLFFQRKADGCRKGDACNHCHFCSAEDCRRIRNRMTTERRKNRPRK
mmetsp:Transcript_32241/g.76956  ORF Transcript_32241/g.76956 Transcript_32241/m.76956 type:complete len:119 (-) Transcript_32241:42-398(-)